MVVFPDGLISMLPGLGWLGVWVALTNAEGNLGGPRGLAGLR